MSQAGFEPATPTSDRLQTHRFRPLGHWDRPIDPATLRLVAQCPTLPQAPVDEVALLYYVSAHSHMLHPPSEWLNCVQVNASGFSKTSGHSATAPCKIRKNWYNIDDNNVIIVAANCSFQHQKSPSSVTRIHFNFTTNDVTQPQLLLTVSAHNPHLLTQTTHILSNFRLSCHAAA